MEPNPAGSFLGDDNDQLIMMVELVERHTELKRGYGSSRWSFVRDLSWPFSLVMRSVFGLVFERSVVL